MQRERGRSEGVRMAGRADLVGGGGVREEEEERWWW